MFAECPGTLHASYTWFFGPMNVRGIYRICILLRTDETSSSITVSTTQCVCVCVWNRLPKDANEGRHFDYQSIFFYRISCNGPIQNDSMACDMFVYFTSMGWNVANEHSHPLTASIPPLTHSLTHSLCRLVVHILILKLSSGNALQYCRTFISFIGFMVDRIGISKLINWTVASI